MVVVDKEMMILSQRSAARLIYRSSEQLLAHAEIEKRSGAHSDMGNPLWSRWERQRSEARCETHGRSKWVMSEAIATLGIRVTAEIATRAIMARQPSPAPASEVIMKSTGMSLNVR